MTQVRILGAAGIALALGLVLPQLAAAQADKFKVTCPLPFFGIQDHHSIDTICQNAGEGGDDAAAANEEQNRAKNNFCAVIGAGRERPNASEIGASR